MADTILVIDDSVTVRTAVRWVAESAGHRVLEAESLQAARSVVDNTPPDTFLIDYHLPDGKGVDYCAELRKDPRFSGSKILILHGDAHPFDPNDARDANANGALRKPFRSQALLDLLDQAQDVQATVETDAVQTPPPAAPPAPSEDEDTIFADADIVEESSPAPTPPSPGRKPVRTRSGAYRTPPMPGSGLHRVAPPGGQKVSVAGRGTMPRSPSGAFRAVDEQVPEAPAAPAAPAPSERTPAAPPSAPAAQTSSRNEPTAEVNVLDDEDIETSGDTPTQSTHKTFQLNEQELRAQIEEIVGSVIEEKLEAIVEKELPQIARRALAGLLRTELNEQIVRLGVTRRVQQFLDNDLPNYAQRAVDRRLDQNDNS